MQPLRTIWHRLHRVTYQQAQGETTSEFEERMSRTGAQNEHYFYLLVLLIIQTQQRWIYLLGSACHLHVNPQLLVKPEIMRLPFFIRLDQRHVELPEERRNELVHFCQ